MNEWTERGKVLITQPCWNCTNLRSSKFKSKVWKIKWLFYIFSVHWRSLYLLGNLHSIFWNISLNKSWGSHQREYIFLLQNQCKSKSMKYEPAFPAIVSRITEMMRHWNSYLSIYFAGAMIAYIVIFMRFHQNQDLR